MYANMTALVIDDTATTRQFVTRILQSELHFLKVFQAANAREGLARLAENENISIIICDWEMPKLSGLSFLARIKEEDRWKNIPFIMATSRSDKPSIVKAIEAGVNDYVTKPFTGQTLEAKIQRLLQKRSNQTLNDVSRAIVKTQTEEFVGEVTQIATGGCTLKAKTTKHQNEEFSDVKIFFRQKQDSFFVGAGLLNAKSIDEENNAELSFAFNKVDAETLAKINKYIAARK